MKKMVVALLCLLQATAVAASGTTIQVNGTEVGSVPNPTLTDSGDAFVPFRLIAERLGASVYYKNRRVYARRGALYTEIRIGHRGAEVNRHHVELNAPPHIDASTGRTFVTARTFKKLKLAAMAVYFANVDRAVFNLFTSPCTISNGQGLTVSSPSPGPSTYTTGHPPVGGKFVNSPLAQLRACVNGAEVSERVAALQSGGSGQPITQFYLASKALPASAVQVELLGADASNNQYYYEWSFTSDGTTTSTNTFTAAAAEQTDGSFIVSGNQNSGWSIMVAPTSTYNACASEAAVYATSPPVTSTGTTYTTSEFSVVIPNNTKTAHALVIETSPDGKFADSHCIKVTPSPSPTPTPTP